MPGEPDDRAGRRLRRAARAARASSATPVVDLDAVLDHYVDGAPLPRRRVLITFDDGYRDNLENAAAGAAAARLSGGASSSRSATSTTRTPLPHEEHLAEPRRPQPDARLGAISPSSTRGGVRVESHGIGHRPLAELEVDEAAREIALSKLRLEERLGRPVRAFAYVKGSEAHYRPVHLSLLKQAGYEVAFTSISGANGPADRPAPARTATTSSRTRRARSSSCSPARATSSRVKDTVAGTHARRLFNAALGTSTRSERLRARRVRAGAPRRRTCGLLARRVGRAARCPATEFEWWFERQPGRPLRSVRSRGRRRSSASPGTRSTAWSIGGEEALVGDAAARRDRPAATGAAGSSWSSSATNEREASRAWASALRAAFAERADGAGLPRHARLVADCRELRSGRGRSLRGSTRVRPAALARSTARRRACRELGANHVIRDAAYLQLALRRLAARLRALAGRRATRSSAGKRPGRGRSSRRRRPRAVGRRCSAGARAARRPVAVSRCLPPEQRAALRSRAASCPTPRTLQLASARRSAARLNTDPRAWHFTLGDRDFF